MSLCERDVMVRREQCRDLLRQAERERLARLALSTPRATWYRVALHRLGGCLQAWGHKLLDLGKAPTYGKRPVSRAT